MAVGAAAALIGAGGAITKGLFGYQSANYQAEVAKMNEKIAKQNADRAIERSGIEQEQSDRFETAALLGEQEAAQAASGLSLTGKSAIQTRASARRLGRLDALNIRQAGEIEAYNFRTDAANFAAERQAAKMSGTASLVGGFFDAAGSIAGAPAGTWDSLISKSPATGKKIPTPVSKPVGLVY